MKTVTRTTAKVDELQFGYWNHDAKEFVPINEMNDAELKAAAEKLGCSELLLDALMMFAANVSEMVSGDLKDIRGRLPD